MTAFSNQPNHPTDQPTRFTRFSDWYKNEAHPAVVLLLAPFIFVFSLMLIPLVVVLAVRRQIINLLRKGDLHMATTATPTTAQVIEERRKAWKKYIKFSMTRTTKIVIELALTMLFFGFALGYLFMVQDAPVEWDEITSYIAMIFLLFLLRRVIQDLDDSAWSVNEIGETLTLMDAKLDVIHARQDPHDDYDVSDERIAAAFE